MINSQTMSRNVSTTLASGMLFEAMPEVAVFYKTGLHFSSSVVG